MRSMLPLFRLTATGLALLMVVGCSTPPDNPEERAEYDRINDPLEPLNRAIFDFNQGVDTVVLRPVAETYRAVVPEFGRDRVGDFLGNLFAPVTFLHDVLQGEFERAGTTLGRFALNSTFGVLGIMDVAEPMGLSEHREDAGQTLGAWGVGEGPYLVLPILGPSNPRDLTGRVADWFVDPFNTWTEGANWARYGRTGGTVVDQRESTLDVLDDLERSSMDYYSTIRSLYRQRRDDEIGNGQGAKLAKPGLQHTPAP